MAGSWGFAIGILVLAGSIVLLARISQRHLEPTATGATLTDGHHLSTRELYGNIVGTQVLVVMVFLGIWWASDITSRELGIVGAHVFDGELVAGALLVGVGVAGLNQASVAVLTRLRIMYSKALREALAPGDWREWVLLLGGVLPVIAVGEELVFRAALIGGLGAALGVSPWLLVGLTAIAFGLGHGMQGQGGVIVTSALGVVLGAAFVVTQSFLFVAIAHYVVNAMEFIQHER